MLEPLHLFYVTAAVLAVSWIAWRIYKRWMRRCKQCGSLLYRRYGENDLQPDGTSFSSMMFECRNKKCGSYGTPVPEDVHKAHFGRVGLVWRRLKHEKFL